MERTRTEHDGVGSSKVRAGSSITDGLREWARRYAYFKADVMSIADRIDAEHEAACAEAYGNGVESVALPDMTAYVKLPVDADGEVIHIGDRVENNERVVRIVLTDGSWEPSVYVEKLPNVLHEHFCHEISHYHAPTVEDVLREFGRGWYEQMNGPETFDVADYVERYAAKLRLAGEAE